MATGSGKRQGRKKLVDGHGSNGSGDVDTGLPIQPPDTQGSQRSAAVRDDGGKQLQHPPVRDDAGGSAARSDWQDSAWALFGNRRGLRTSSVGDRRNSSGSQEESLRRAKTVELTQLPHVPDRYIEPAEEAIAEIADDGLRDRDELRLEQDHALLTRVASKSLKVMEDVLDIPTPPSSDPNYVRIVSIKKDVAVSGVTARLKADENAFRKRQSDALAELYEQVGNAIGRRPGTLIDATPA